MLLNIEKDKWKEKRNKGILDYKNSKFIVDNKNNESIMVKYTEKIKMDKTDDITQLKIVVKGNVTNSGGYIVINDEYKLPVNSETIIKYKNEKSFNIRLIVSANSKVELETISFDIDNESNLLESIDKKKEVLIVVPNYPSYVNLYACAFAHSRNREYVKNKLKIQVFYVNETINYQSIYERDSVPVMIGSYQDLKGLLLERHYPVILTHFVDEYLYPIYEGNVYENQKLIFICHGPEVVYKYLVNKTRYYFSEPINEDVINKRFKNKDIYVKRFAQKDNVEWVFVSDWLKEFAEEQQNLKFKHARVINNFIDGDLFKFTKRDKELRKKILMVRKFDNICQHSIDQVVLCILELSRRDFFDDLTFDIYGDGNYYDELVEPLKQFKNVNLIRRFIPNEQLNEIYAKHGLMLLPSRHDAHAVSMGESALSGLVVLGSAVTSNPYFMNQKENHTLTDPEDYIALADIIERFYKDPEDFLRVSENMHNFTSQFNKENTVMKEVELIRECIKKSTKELTFIPTKKEKPILTIGVPAYNVEKYIEKTLVSILKAKNASKIEVLVINDGSKDNTAKIVSKYEKESNGIVRLIDKENGGHGSTINRAIKEAKGKYFRLVDGDDWVDYENLDKLIDIMKTNDCDIILTTGSYDYVEQASFENIISYNNMAEGGIYNFEDLTYPLYGFKKYGPLLTTGNYKTKMLQESNFTISEKKPYVDMEFNAFSIRLAKTITYYDLNIYRYLIGREGQTISRDFWKKKYKDHEYIIFSILNYIEENDYSERKKEYVMRNIIAPMVDSQIFMYDAICKWKDIDPFLVKLKEYGNAYKESINYINKVNGNCALILRKYKNKHGNKSIIVPGKYETPDDYHRLVEASGIKSKTKLLTKALLPYGLVRIIQKRRR